MESENKIRKELELLRNEGKIKITVGKKECWDEKMCERLGIPMEFLPEICDKNWMVILKRIQHKTVKL